MVQEVSASAFTPRAATFSPPLTLTRRQHEPTAREHRPIADRRLAQLCSLATRATLKILDLDRLVTRGRPDILIGGPPCQGFSRLGRAKLDSLTEEGHEADPRNDLYLRFLDAAELWRPLAVVMENVPGMLSIGGRNIADDAAADLAARGYQVGYAVLNAVWYGVPQFRERLFFIGIRDDLDVIPIMPPATHIAALPSGYFRPRAEWTAPLPFIRHSELPVEMRRARTLRHYSVGGHRRPAALNRPSVGWLATIEARGRNSGLRGRAAFAVCENHAHVAWPSSCACSEGPCHTQDASRIMKRSGGWQCRDVCRWRHDGVTSKSSRMPMKNSRSRYCGTPYQTALRTA